MQCLEARSDADLDKQQLHMCSYQTVMALQLRPFHEMVNLLSWSAVVLAAFLLSLYLFIEDANTDFRLNLPKPAIANVHPVSQFTNGSHSVVPIIHGSLLYIDKRISSEAFSQTGG